MNASVKVMNSYDYCHFEVALSAESVTLEETDEMRKEAQRLVDKAIKQYKIAKRASEHKPDSYLTQQVKVIQENYPKSEWTPEQKAAIKDYEDRIHQSMYDYEDDWEE